MNRLDKDGKIYYEKFIARMRVTWNLAYHNTRRQQDADRQDRDRSADASPSYQPNDRVCFSGFPVATTPTSSPGNGKVLTASRPPMVFFPTATIA